MMQSQEFITAEVAYRMQRVTDGLRVERRRRTLRSYLHLPALPVGTGPALVRPRTSDIGTR